MPRDRGIKSDSGEAVEERSCYRDITNRHGVD